jgi:hypothetical protein
VSHKFEALGEIGYLAKYVIGKGGKVVANHIFPISDVRIFM